MTNIRGDDSALRDLELDPLCMSLDYCRQRNTFRGYATCKVETVLHFTAILLALCWTAVFSIF